MSRSRALSLVAALSLALGVGVTAGPASADPVGSEAQSISFTTTPPQGSDWFFGDFHSQPGYVVDAVATSGLPVSYSLDPASVGICKVFGVQDSPIYGHGAPVEFLRAGTCTIRADQPGNDEYAAADQVSQSFVIEKVPTWMSAAHANKGVLGLSPSTFTATLQKPFEMGPGWSLEGYPGQRVTFSVGGKQVCSALTNADGVATCKASIGLANATKESTYTATYAGSQDYLGVTAQGKLG